MCLYYVYEVRKSYLLVILFNTIQYNNLQLLHVTFKFLLFSQVQNHLLPTTAVPILLCADDTITSLQKNGREQTSLGTPCCCVLLATLLVLNLRWNALRMTAKDFSLCANRMRVVFSQSSLKAVSVSQYCRSLILSYSTTAACA